ncbi:uncharacterized protein LOC133196559 [Saccostrea echinata]|uniref:uncharacterized protein LOC133196559 n=1 Tax=Saccostrea echinata TaxID=191078 RepID=UPI002A8321E1|nr:uncharacterized protein LOC133196559 [Saccostrea echinata]XP_061188412.1 uncharacterized protein LOC133196559 [Saccostrea echinata]
MKTVPRSLLLLGVLTALTLFVFTYLSKKADHLQPQGSSKENISSGTNDRLTKMTNKTNHVLSAAMRISEGGQKALLVTLVNDAFLPFAFSWLCNTQGMGIHNQVLFITGDKESAKKINEKWPSVTAVQLDGVHSGNQEYSHVGYVEMMVRRSEVLLEILEQNIPIFLFEVDCLWIKNPLENLRSYSDVDIVVNAVSERSKIIAGGFLYMHPNEASKQMWRALTEQLTDLGEKIKNSPDTQLISESDNDQVYLSQLLFSKYGGLKYKILSTQDYADGKWYKLSKEKREQLKPYLINNNWVIGNAAKIMRAKEWGHWFLKNSGECDQERVQKVVRQGLL